MTSLSYPGHRILAAMRSAPRYADAIFRLLRAAVPPGSSRILDFGAGDGMYAERFLREGGRIDCVEPDPANRRSLVALGLSPLETIAALPDDRYDFIYTVNVLEHIRDLDHHVVELRRVLRPGGRLFAFVPAFAILWTSLDDEVGHVQQFTRASLTEALARGGFVNDHCRYFDSLGFVAALSIRAFETIATFRYSPRQARFYDRMLLPASLVGDRLLSGVVGKNVMAVAHKPAADRMSPAPGRADIRP